MSEFKLSSCTGKKRYESRGRADFVLREMQKRNNFSGSVSVYKCRICNCWHLGGESPRELVSLRKTNNRISDDWLEPEAERDTQVTPKPPVEVEQKESPMTLEDALKRLAQQRDARIEQAKAEYERHAGAIRAAMQAAAGLPAVDEATLPDTSKVTAADARRVMQSIVGEFDIHKIAEYGGWKCSYDKNSIRSHIQSMSRTGEIVLVKSAEGWGKPAVYKYVGKPQKNLIGAA